MPALAPGSLASLHYLNGKGIADYTYHWEHMGAHLPKDGVARVETCLWYALTETVYVVVVVQVGWLTVRG